MRFLRTLVAFATMTSSPALFVSAQPDSGTFAIFKLQHRVGAESWTARPAEAGNGKVITATWLFTYIGSTVRLTESLSLGADGSPLALSAHGHVDAH
jgi:hypothetical protein